MSDVIRTVIFGVIAYNEHRCLPDLLEYRNIKVLKKYKRIQPSGWNVVINSTETDVLFCVDAHARLPEDFIEASMDCVASGEFVCGGACENIIDENTPWKRMLLNAEKSMFGSGMSCLLMTGAVL